MELDRFFTALTKISKDPATSASAVTEVAKVRTLAGRYGARAPLLGARAGKTDAETQADIKASIAAAREDGGTREISETGKKLLGEYKQCDRDAEAVGLT